MNLQHQAVNSEVCPTCGGEAAEIVLSDSVHYSRIVCPQCDRFIRWGKHPGTVLRNQLLQAKLDAIQNAAERLTNWEAQFIASVCQQVENNKKLSPKQAGIVDRIYQSIGGVDEDRS